MSIAISDGVGSVVVTYSTNKKIKQVELFSFPTTAAATQGDYIAFSNVASQTFAAWLDIDTDGTEPTGLFFGNSAVQIKVPIVTGGTAIQNAAAFVAACEADGDWDGITLTDNEDGTVTVTQDTASVCGDAIAFNADDSDEGSIGFSMVSQGLSPTITREDTYPKGTFTTVADVRRNIIVFNQSASSGVGAKGRESASFDYADISSPSSTGILDLKQQIDTWTTAFDPSDYGVCDGEFDATLSDTEDLLYSGFIQPTLLGGTVKYTTVDGDVRTRAFEQNEVSLFRVKRVWETGTTPDMGIVVIH